jgi:outer membrane lipopolysaccharide assembly protein LptE/RlpB
LETVVSNAMMRQFTTLNPVALARSRQDADAVVNGDVTAIRITTISRRGQTVAAERQVTLTAKATLTTVGGKVISQTGAVSANETYRVVPNDFQATQDRQSRAIASAAEKLAENLYNRLAVRF